MGENIAADTKSRNQYYHLLAGAQNETRKKLWQVIKFYFYSGVKRKKFKRDFHQILCFPADSFLVFPSIPGVMKRKQTYDVERMRCCLCQMP